MSTGAHEVWVTIRGLKVGSCVAWFTLRPGHNSCCQSRQNTPIPSAKQLFRTEAGCLHRYNEVVIPPAQEFPIDFILK